MEMNIYGHINNTGSIESTTATATNAEDIKFGILKICLFSTFFVLGLIGNSLVLIGIGLNKGMQTPTNLLIFNLALADILFIIVCIPTTLFSLNGRWTLADVGCKLAQFISHLSAFMSIYLLVFMSVDRYLAVVHAVDSMVRYRTIKNTTKCIIALWLIGICLSAFIGSLFKVIEFGSVGQTSKSKYCLLRYFQTDPPTNAIHTDPINLTRNMTLVDRTVDVPSNATAGTVPIEASIYWLGFVIFLYAVPLTIVVILYGLMLKFLRGARGQSVGKGKRRATRMILAVVLTYALCWFLMQLLFISNVVLSKNISHNFENYMDILTTFANVFAYLNSCTNPILYGFLSKNFRSSFIDLLCCRYLKRSLFGPHDSLRGRRAVVGHTNSFPTRYRRSDFSMRTSIVSHTLQMDPLPETKASGGRIYSTTHLMTELLPKVEQPELNKDNENHINVGTQTNALDKSHRRRKHGDRASDIAYGSFIAQSTRNNLEVLCT